MDLKENIEYSERLIIKLLPGIIHELNSPIQFIHDNLEYIEHEIEQDDMDKDEIKDAVKDSLTGNRTMNRIIKGLSLLSSDFYRPFQDFPADEVFESALYVTRNLWKYKFILEYDKEGGGISVWCSPFSLILSLCCVVEILVSECSKEETLSGQQKLYAGINFDNENVFFWIEAESDSAKLWTADYQRSSSYITAGYLINDHSKGRLDILFESERVKGIIKLPLKGLYETSQ